jgi:hypothetical protein
MKHCDDSRAQRTQLAGAATAQSALLCPCRRRCRRHRRVARRIGARAAGRAAARAAAPPPHGGSCRRRVCVRPC